MAKCESIGSILAAGGGGGGAGRGDGGFAFGFRLWPVISAAAFRRRLINALMCGASSNRRKQRSCCSAPEAPPPAPPSRRKQGSDRLSELLKAEASESGSDEAEAEAETRRKVEVFEEMQAVVRRLQCDDKEGGDKRPEAAKDVRRLAKDDPDARETLVMLGAIPPLVGMLDSGDLSLQIDSLYALLNLGIANDMNKAAIVAAGAVHKMLKLIESGSPTSISEAIVANFLGLSALDSNKPIIGSSGAVPFLVRTFQNKVPSQARQDSLRALFNLSIAAVNTSYLIESNLVPSLFSAIGDMEVSERVLSILSNVVSSSSEGRRTVSSVADAFPILIDVLNWSDSPGCQEKAAYILMVMVHKAYRDRTAMIEAGVVSALLELTLIGTALAQKRASRILECLRVDKGKQVSEGFEGCSKVAPAVSAPLEKGKAAAGVEEMAAMSEERRAVKEMVQQSLQSNMRRIVKRANLPQDFAPSDHFKTLTATSTSKSLPF